MRGKHISPLRAPAEKLASSYRAPAPLVYSYKLAISPFYTLYHSAVRPDGYWQGLVFTKISRDKFFASTYFYDMQGNLRETKSYFNIKRRGRLTNWKIQFPSRRTSPVLVRTF